jgi:hypothetical protein
MKKKDQLIVFFMNGPYTNISIWVLKPVPQKDTEKYGIMGVLGQMICCTDDKAFDYTGNLPYEGRVILDCRLYSGLSYSICEKETADKYIQEHIERGRLNIKRKIEAEEQHIEIVQRNLEDLKNELLEFDKSVCKYKELLKNIKG